MKYKTLFRLLLKVVGVIVFAQGAATAIAVVGAFVQSLTSRYSGQTIFYTQYLVGSIGPAAQIVFGLYLFFDGKWIVDKAIPGNRNYCHECGYDLTGATGHICNECGTAFRTEESTWKLPPSAGE